MIGTPENGPMILEIPTCLQPGRRKVCAIDFGQIWATSQDLSDQALPSCFQGLKQGTANCLVDVF